MVALNISLEPEFVITAELAVLRQREEQLGLSAEQQEKVREVRRKGRNINCATNSRKRKVENIEDLKVTQLSQSELLTKNVISREKLKQ